VTGIHPATAYRTDGVQEAPPMQHRHSIALALFVLLLSPSLLWAKPKTITVTIDSAPRAAMLYDRESGRYIGDTPYRLKVTVEGCQNMPGLQARWASGATAEITFLTVCAHGGGKQSYRFERPTEAPNLATDIQIAQAVQAQKEAHDYAMAAIITQAFQNFNVGMANYAATSALLYRPAVSCLTIPSRVAIQTWCR
jgi:hypothetical protein